MIDNAGASGEGETRRIGSTRRGFLRTAGSCAAAAWLVGAGPGRGRRGRLQAADPLPGAADLIAGKDARLIVHNAKTAEIETPLALLGEHEITPKNVLFVRSNQELAGTRTTEASQRAGWTIDFAGLVETPRTIGIDALLALEQTEVEMVLQCSGNGRALFSK